MEIWKSALLGLIQGLTEFFPVSSDGHLVAFGSWIGTRVPGSGASVEAALHVGTLFAVLVAFRRELAQLLPLALAPRRWLAPAPDDPLGQDARFVAVGSLVTAAVAWPLLDRFRALYDSRDALIACLLLTGALLIASRFLLERRALPSSWWQAALVGAAQALAVLPGLSRSCTTVVVGLLVGIPLTRVAGLSFLLSIPAVIGAALVETLHAPPRAADLGALAVGIVVAFASGLFAATAMLKLVPRRRLHWFAPWALLLAGAVSIF